MSYVISGIVFLVRAAAPGTLLFCAVVFLRRLFARICRRTDASTEKAEDKTSLDVAAKDDNRFPRYVLGYILSLYAAVVCLITGVGNIFSWSFRSEITSYNLLPLCNINDPTLWLNILLFLPLGVLLPPVFRRMRRWYATVGTGFLATLAIECIQMFFVGREGDIDDIIANTIGCAVGYGIWCGIRKCFHATSMERKIGQGSLPLIICPVVVLLVLPFRHMCIADVMLFYLGLPTWSGNTQAVLSQSGLHYTLIIMSVFPAISLLLSLKWRKDFGAKQGTFLSLFVIIFMAVLLVMQI